MVTFKEMAAVSAGGAPYDTQKVELANGMIKLAIDVQFMIMQGNQTNSGGTFTNEGGYYFNPAAGNPQAFDGLRGVTGGYGSFSTNGAIAIDVGTLNTVEAMQFVAAKSANAGGMPDLVFMGMNAKQGLDSENQNNQRYNNDFVEITPGVRVNRVNWANGALEIVPVPGNTIGTYNRTSDGALVEDIYILDSRTITMRWLYSETLTVLQIPSGADGILSNRFIIFLMTGMELAAPLFYGKCRRLAS